jgi:hypothetical protein
MTCKRCSVPDRSSGFLKVCVFHNARQRHAKQPRPPAAIVRPHPAGSRAVCRTVAPCPGRTGPSVQGTRRPMDRTVPEASARLHPADEKAAFLTGLARRTAAKMRPRTSHARPVSVRTSIVRSAISFISPISSTSRPSMSALATIASSRQHRRCSGGASRIQTAVRNTMSAHLSRCRAMTLCRR